MQGDECEGGTVIEKHREFYTTLASGVRYDFERAEFYDGTFGIAEDLIAPLARQARYNGHTSRPWSVAAHAVLVHDIVAAQFPGDSMLRMMALHHDDEESVVGDRTTPVKRWCQADEDRAGRDVFADMAHHVQLAIERALGLGDFRRLYETSATARHFVKHADLLAYVAESRRLRHRKTHGDVRGMPSAEVDEALALFDHVDRSLGYTEVGLMFAFRHDRAMAGDAWSHAAVTSRYVPVVP